MWACLAKEMAIGTRYSRRRWARPRGWRLKERIFVSSVQKELAEERRALKDYVQGDPLLERFFDVFLFEDVPAKDRRADQIYLEEVDRSRIYVGLFAEEMAS